MTAQIKFMKYRWLLIILLVMGFNLSQAAVPNSISYQGYLTDPAGAPSDGNISITFSIYSVSAGGAPLWTDTQIVSVSKGLFNVELGGGSFPANLFDTPIWLGITVDTDAEMSPRSPFDSNAFAFKADDADTVGGQSAASLDQSSHVSDFTNPHNVTAGQVGAADGAALNAHINNTSNPHSVTDTQTGAAANLSAHQSNASAHHTKTTTLTWGAVTNKPAGFADNIDNDSGGDITGVSAGVGLNGGGFIGNVVLNVDVPLSLTGNTSGSVITSTNTSNIALSRALHGINTALSGGGSSTGVRGENRSTTGSGIGVWGSQNGSGWGVYGQTPGGRGVYGSSSTGVGGYFTSTSGFGLIVANGRAGFGTTSPENRISLTGTGSLNGIKIGQGQTDEITLYHTSSALRVIAPNGRVQFGSLEYIEDCGANCIAFPAADVGLGTSTPAVRLHLNDTSDASLANGSGVFLIGQETGPNVVMDGNEILARNNGVASKLFLNNGGTHVVVPGLQITGGADLVEPFDVNSLDDIKAGMVMAIDTDKPGQLRIADKAYDRTVAGIVSGANGINPGLSMAQQGSIADGSKPIALTGRLYALADASYSDIQPGDLLTTSETPGHVMKVTDYSKAHGSIIGKAMTPLKQGKGYVLILVSLQ